MSPYTAGTTESRSSCRKVPSDWLRELPLFLDQLGRCSQFILINNLYLSKIDGLIEIDKEVERGREIEIDRDRDR